jgi:hypothetical protein
MNTTPTKNKILYLKTKFKYTMLKVKIVAVHSIKGDEVMEV